MEPFTEHLRETLSFAQRLASAQDATQVEPDHILQALLVRDSIALVSRALSYLGKEYSPPPRTPGMLEDAQPTGRTRLRFSNESKLGLELALREALALGQTTVDDVHVLLVLTKDANLASLILAQTGVDSSNLRQAILEILSS